MIGEDFCGAAEDGGVAVDGGVAGGHADAVGAEVAAEGEEFFVDEGLDRTGVDRAVACGEGAEVEGGGDEGFAGACGGIEDDVSAGEEVEDGFFLGWIEVHAAGGDDAEEAAEEIVRGGVARWWECVLERAVIHGDYEVGAGAGAEADWTRERMEERKRFSREGSEGWSS